MSIQKLSLCLFFSCALLQAALGQTFPVTTIVNNGPSAKRVNLVFVSDGYTSAELPTFITNATTIKNAMFSTPPLQEYANFFNVYAVQVPSTQSGAKHPGTATDVTEPASPITNPANYFNSSFDASSIHRLLVGNSGSVQSVVASNVPGYDQIMLVVNSTVYGGSGGSIATGSINASSGEIMIHEIGHSFANLGDEYWFNCAERKNRTANNNPATVIWKNWLGANGVNIYQIGTSGGAATCYRPHQNCKMKALGVPFCAVCKEAFIDKIYNLVSPIDQFTPASNSLGFTGPSMDFSLNLVLPSPNTLQTEWVLNGVTVATSGSTYALTAANLVEGNNVLQAKVTDASGLSRAYWPATSGYLHSVTWNIAYSALPVELLDFQARLMGEKVRLDWETASENNSGFFAVERSSDGRNFRQIGTVKAAGFSTATLPYFFDDLHPFSGINYYRLQQVDKNGDRQVSPIRPVNRIDKLQYQIYPNPTSDFIQVSVTLQSPEQVSFFLYDLTGKLVTERHFDTTENAQAAFDIQALPAGEYALEIVAGQVKIQKMVVKQ